MHDRANPMTMDFAHFDPELSLEALEAASGPDFGAWLLGAAQRFAKVDEIYAYRFTSSGGPCALISTGHDGDAGGRAALYANRFHPYDPMLLGGGRRTAGFVHVEARDINHKDYRHLCFDKPRFVDKLSFRWVRRDDAYYVSFYRCRADGDTALPALAKLADIGLSSLVSFRKSCRVQPAAPLVDRLAQQLAEAYVDLTAREVEVCARTLSGNSASQIAAALSLKTSTVLTYRQRAYGRYGMTSAAGFLEKLI